MKALITDAGGTLAGNDAFPVGGALLVVAVGALHCDLLWLAGEETEHG